MENSDRARSETSSESEAGELREDWPIVLDEVRRLERANGSLPLEVLDNRPLNAPQYGAKLSKFYAALSNQTAATRAEERDDPTSSEGTGSFVQLGRPGGGWTRRLTDPMLPLRRPASVIDDPRSFHAANETVSHQSDVNSSPPKHLTMRTQMKMLLAAMYEYTASKVDAPDKELEDI